MSWKSTQQINNQTITNGRGSYLYLLADDHVDDAAPSQVQYVPDADHDGRTDAQRSDHPHVAQVGEYSVVERPEREHRYDGAQRE